MLQGAPKPPFLNFRSMNAIVVEQRACGVLLPTPRLLPEVS